MKNLFKNFYKPAPKDIQRYCATLKAVGAIVAASTLVGAYPWVAGLGLLLSAIGEGWEKLSDTKPVPTSPSGEPVESVDHHA